VTSRQHMIERKGVDPVPVRNLIRLLVTSNNHWVVPAGMEERRFAVVDLGEAAIQNAEYFAAIDDEMANGGREALLDYLLRFDLSNVDLRCSTPSKATIHPPLTRVRLVGIANSAITLLLPTWHINRTGLAGQLTMHPILN